MKAARLIAIALSSAALAVGFAACGDDDEPAAATTEATTEAATTESAAADGAAVFSANCAGCHTLAAAEASGAVGPNLDELKPAKDRVAAQVTNGGGGMPAFGDQLSAEEIDAVASYVADNAGG